MDPDHGPEGESTYKFMSLEETNMKDQKEKVPVFRSWTAWYLLVIGFLILVILLFYLFTKTFS